MRTFKNLLRVFSATLLFSVAGAGQMQAQDIKTYTADTLYVVGTRATSKTPVTVENIKAEKLKSKNFGQDLPSLLGGITSLTFTSDAGSGIGYTSLSLRGIDASRINITANGVPVNDSESHTVFWVNMPNFVSSLKNIQVIRGAGVSTHGAGAFGGTINMQMEDLAQKAGGEATVGLGAFSTKMAQLGVQTGRFLNGKMAASLKVSGTKSDGFVDRATVDLKSYHFQTAYYTDNGIYRLINFGGRQKTGIAWNGISQQQWDELGPTYNTAGIIPPFDGKAETYYPSTDNYDQNHTHLMATNMWGNGFKTQLTLHYTRGKGFTDEYRVRRKLKEYGLPTYVDANGEKVKRRELVREKWLDNNFYGGVFTLEKKADNYRLTAGLAGNYYEGDHFGYVRYVRDYPLPYSTLHRYYDNTSKKTDLSGYLRAEWNLTDNLIVYGDYMLRYINYKMNGPTDKMNDYTGAMDILDIDTNFTFHLPKVGLMWSPWLRHKLYASVSTAAREPNRKAYTESPKRDANGNVIFPKPEHMIDFELGYSFVGNNFTAELNGYYMKYKDQLVPNGQLSDVGDVLLVNVPDSYRTGLELALEYRPVSWLTYSGNVTLSKNIITQHKQTHAVYDQDWNYIKTIEEDITDAPIANSPNLIWNSTLMFHKAGFVASLNAHGQGKQYLDNSGLEARVLDGFTVLNAQIGYNFISSLGVDAVLSLQVNNLLNKSYASSAYIYDAGFQGASGAEKDYVDIRYFPQAGRHVMSTLSIKF